MGIIGFLHSIILPNFYYFNLITSNAIHPLKFVYCILEIPSDSDTDTPTLIPQFCSPPWCVIISPFLPICQRKLKNKGVYKCLSPLLSSSRCSPVPLPHFTYKTRYINFSLKTKYSSTPFSYNALHSLFQINKCYRSVYSSSPYISQRFD